MTDYSDLVKRLRFRMNLDDPQLAADAIEAQAARITHLEEMFHGWRDEAQKASARIAELEAALTAEKADWRPMSEAPERRDEILVFRPDAGVFTAFFMEDDECWFSMSGDDLTGDMPTHFRPFPEPPARAALEGK